MFEQALDYSRLPKSVHLELDSNSISLRVGTPSEYCSRIFFIAIFCRTFNSRIKLTKVEYLDNYPLILNKSL